MKTILFEEAGEWQQLACALSGELPDAIVYVPEGEHTVNASVNGERKTVTVNVTPEKGPEIAARLQRDLEIKLAENVQPFIDYDHEGGEAAAHPEYFSYQKGMGIILHLKWTASGRSAVEGRNWSFFSPVFLFSENGEPQGLSKTKSDIGALVNEPAFREIPRIAAKHIEAEEPPAPEPAQKNDLPNFEKNDSGEGMKDLEAIKARLADAGIIKASEADALTGDAIAARIEAALTQLKDTTEIDELKAKFTELSTEHEELAAKVEEQKAERLEGLIAKAVEAQQIAPKDEKAKDFYRLAAKADYDATVDQLERLAASGPDLKSTRLTGGQENEQPGVTADELRARARDEADKRGISYERAMSNIGADNDSYEQYRKNLMATGSPIDGK